MPAASRASLVAYAIRLSFLTIAWNAVVGVAALVSSIVSGSLALGGFALNMLIDTSASFVLVWRFTHESRDPEAADRLEERAQVGIAVAMFAVAAYVAIQAVRALVERSHPGTSVLGAILALASLLVLPPLARVKLRVASELPSRALRGDGVLTAASAGLAAMALMALLANSLFDWWWADPVSALVIAAALVAEASRLATHRLGRERLFR